MSIGDRIKILRGKENQTTFGSRFGASRNTIMRYESGERTPDADFIAALCKHYEVDPSWLLFGEGHRPFKGPAQRAAEGISTAPERPKGLATRIAEGDYGIEERPKGLAQRLSEEGCWPEERPRSLAQRLEEDGLDGDEYIKIPRYEVAASAGGGTIVHSEQVVDYLSFRAEWVRNALGVSVQNLALISVIGDSMDPTLSDGDVVLLDMTTRKVLDGSIYALQLNGGLLVKRIQRKLDGSVVVKSDNPRYDQEVVSEDAADQLKIIGRVVWVGRRL